MVDGKCSHCFHGKVTGIRNEVVWRNIDQIVSIQYPAEHDCPIDGFGNIQLIVWNFITLLTAGNFRRNVLEAAVNDAGDFWTFLLAATVDDLSLRLVHPTVMDLLAQPSQRGGKLGIRQSQCLAKIPSGRIRQVHEVEVGVQNLQLGAGGRAGGPLSSGGKWDSRRCKRTLGKGSSDVSSLDTVPNQREAVIYPLLQAFIDVLGQICIARTAQKLSVTRTQVGFEDT
ncbi:hypothetical protein NUU61_002373 [Penicillium alfredii]|uniref:Uncharacterized protein n=1 Tax=Penicillium alfredii TaxID=1506179 RepID=A0A9W9FRD7_9EURO|nr:uncharacterized protein NUU61_002373 [Penicillium alfredii]KAJ5105026.1 hypothetical protein NUU61_002373 [Penicillium alfredii]